MIFKKNLLSKLDAISILELIHTSLFCSNEDDFRRLDTELRRVISYDFSVSGLAKMDNHGCLTSYEIINLGYPSEWLDVYTRNNFYQIDSIVKENFTYFRLQRWQDTFRKNFTPKEFLYYAEDFGLKDGFTHGQKNLMNTTGSLFSISGNSVEYTRRTEMILELVMPHLHQAIIRIVDQSVKKSASPLSRREIEVLNWLKQGKSSWDISMILRISERTVNYHINNIKQKLDAVNRLQAVAVAVQQGLIEIE